MPGPRSIQPLKLPLCKICADGNTQTSKELLHPSEKRLATKNGGLDFIPNSWSLQHPSGTLCKNNLEKME